MLSEPFPLEDIEWRVSRSGMGSKGIFCMVLAYVTARAIQKRLDDVCGPENWQLTEPKSLEVNGKNGFAVGISIRVGDEWITKWDAAEPTNIHPVKGGFSGAMKRAGAQWGIGRYLYHLDETFAEVREDTPIDRKSWNYATLSEKQGGAKFYWKNPSLPPWALPPEPEHVVSASQLDELKRNWRTAMAPDSKNAAELREGFARFVASHCGDFPFSDHTCWTSEALAKCQESLLQGAAAGDIDSDVPFG